MTGLWGALKTDHLLDVFSAPHHEVVCPRVYIPAEVIMVNTQEAINE